MNKKYHIHITNICHPFMACIFLRLSLFGSYLVSILFVHFLLSEAWRTNAIFTIIFLFTSYFLMFFFVRFLLLYISVFISCLTVFFLVLFCSVLTLWLTLTMFSSYLAICIFYISYPPICSFVYICSYNILICLVNCDSLCSHFIAILFWLFKYWKDNNTFSWFCSKEAMRKVLKLKVKVQKWIEVLLSWTRK